MSMQMRADLGTHTCLVMNPWRSNICIIWLALGADIKTCRSMFDAAEALPKRLMYVAMNERYSG